MEIQNYNQCYEQAVVDLWNACLPCDPLTLQKFRKQALLDDNFDPSLCYVAMADEKVVGFLLATRRKFPYLERGTERTGLDQRLIRRSRTSPSGNRPGFSRKSRSRHEGARR